MMSKTPSALFSDALTAFDRAASLAFTAAQDQARKDVIQATTDAREARKERDEAANALHAHTLEEQAWKQEAGAWKAAANEAELTISHHLETVAQLRQEATQWKNQCLRLEETARQEAISWKEQFLRVEQERLKLAQRVEELVQEQLASGRHTQASITPYTPMPKYPAMHDSAASTRLRRTSTCDSLSSSLQALPPSKSLPSKTASSANRTRTAPVLQLPTPLSENQRVARQKVAQATASQVGSTSSGTRSRILRRVHAVVEVPVKEESVERDAGGLGIRVLPPAPDASSSATSTSKPAATLRTSKVPPSSTEFNKAASLVKRKATAKRRYVEVDDEESEQNSPSERSDTEFQPVSDGDDELLMGAETNRKQTSDTKHVSKPIATRMTRPSIMTKKRKIPASTKKSRPSASLKP